MIYNNRVILVRAVWGTLGDVTSTGVLLVLPKPKTLLTDSLIFIVVDLVVSLTGVSPSPLSFGVRGVPPPAPPPARLFSLSLFLSSRFTVFNAFAYSF